MRVFLRRQASPASQFVTIRIMMSIEEETEDEAPFPINELRNAAIVKYETNRRNVFPIFARILLKRRIFLWLTPTLFLRNMRVTF